MQARNIVILFVSLSVGLTCLLAYASVLTIKKSYLDRLSQSLLVVRDTAHESINLWVKESTGHITLLSKDPDVVASTEELLLLSDVLELKNSPSQQQLRERLLASLDAHDFRGFFVIGPGNINLASSRNANVGKVNLLVSQPDTLARLWSGETLITLPQPSDVPLPDGSGVLTSHYPTMFVAGPIFNHHQEIIALISLRLDPIEKFDKTLEQAQLGVSGNAYVFDKVGNIVSGYESENSLWVKVVEPDTALESGQEILSSESLIYLKNAISTEHRVGRGVNVQGYQDHKNNTVVGAWLWDSKYQYGLAVELGAQEALSPYRQTKHSFAFFSLGASLVFISSALFIYHILLKLRYEEDKYKNLFEYAGEPIVISDLETKKILSANHFACKYLGYQQNELVGLQLSLIRSPSERHRLDRDIAEICRDGSKKIETSFSTKQGETRHVEIIANLLSFGPKKVILSIIRDITSRKQAEFRLSNLLHTDHLTGLGNRTALFIAFDKLALERSRDQGKIALMLLDIDGLKTINNTLGHSIGDQALKAISKRIVQCLSIGQVFRLNGDEFIILVPFSERQEVEHTISSLLTLAKRPLSVKNRLLHVTWSLGVAVSPDNGHEASSLLQYAGTALNEAKQKGSSQTSWFTDRMKREEEYQLQISSALVRAVEWEELNLYFQPIIEASSNRIIGAEALVRWRNPELGAVSPARFIPIAEQNGSIDEIGQWVMEEAFMLRKQWSRYVPDDFRVSINISPAQMHSERTYTALRELMDKYQLPGKSLAIEITESTLLDDNTQILAELAKIKSLGLSLYLDDFGTGYSSLSYVNRYPFDVIKIDRSFIQNIEHNSNSQELAKAIVAMALSLDLELIAEGVETKWQCDFLTQFGCQKFQGYFYGKPLSSEEFFLRYLKKMPVREGA